MDSSKIWFYAIIGAVYILSMLLKKGKKNPAAPPERKRNTLSGPEPSKKLPAPMSFEELLREITAAKEPPREVPVVDYDDQLEKEEKDLENVDYDYRKESDVYATYEEAKKQAFFRPSLEETMSVGDTNVTYGKFKEFDKVRERNLAAEYLKNFTDPAGLRKAVVMSEILKRKF